MSRRKGPVATPLVPLRGSIGDHTTVDDASRYRSDEALSRAWHAEPVARLRGYLSDQGAWSQTQEDSWLAACR